MASNSSETDFQLDHLPALCHWSSNLPSQHLSFPIYKMGILIILLLRICREDLARFSKIKKMRIM